MEHGAAMRANTLLVALLCLGLSGLAGPANADDAHALVLATSSTWSMPAVTLPEIRKLFLGVPLEKDGTRLVPILNTSDKMLYEVFLQKVTYMSSPAYEDQLLSIVFRLGGKRPENFAKLEELLNALRQHPGTVTYLWDYQLAQTHDIRAVMTLWTGSID
jgi:hypothetical protein